MKLTKISFGMLSFFIVAFNYNKIGQRAFHGNHTENFKNQIQNLQSQINCLKQQIDGCNDGDNTN